MTHESSREIDGISPALVERYGQDGLRRLLHPRSAPNYAFQYDRSRARDGSDITAPLPCSRHVADNGKRGWLAVRLVEPDGWGSGGADKWREVGKLPADLKIAGAA
jgi:hypothetical protein